MRGIDSSYAWWRLAASVAISTLGGIGMWCLAVALPAVQTDLGVSRADISFAYTLNMLGFFAGGVLCILLILWASVPRPDLASATAFVPARAEAPRAAVMPGTLM